MLLIDVAALAVLVTIIFLSWWSSKRPDRLSGAVVGWAIAASFLAAGIALLILS